MRLIIKLTIVFAFVYVFLLLVPSPSYTEKIGPSRTLGGEEATTGTLSVFSEPPGLAVFLDGKKVGTAPVSVSDLQPGSHALQVKDDKTEINVVAGKTHRLSYYKGSFLEIPEEAKTVTSPKPETTQPVEKDKPAKDTYEQKRKEEDSRPLYWPLNPKGPIY